MADNYITIIDPEGSGDYSSLTAWESGEQRNLVTLDETETARCESTDGSADDSTLVIAGWTTDATRWIKVTSNSITGDRHEGVWDSNIYRMSKTSNGANINLSQAYVTIDGLQIEVEDQEGITIYSGGQDAGVYTITNNLITPTSTFNSANGYGISTIIGTQTDDEVYIYNNIIYDFDYYLGDGYGILADHPYGESPDIYVYNNTIVNCEQGIRGCSWTPYSTVIINNLVQDSDSYDYYSNFDSTSSTNNLSSDTTVPTYGTYYSEKTVTFNGTGDYRLSTSDTEAKDKGTSLSSTFTTDIVGTTRPEGSYWDLGAYEAELTFPVEGLLPFTPFFGM